MGSIINYTKAQLKQKFSHPVKAIILFLLPLFFFGGSVAGGKAMFHYREKTDEGVSLQHILITVSVLTFYLLYTCTAAYDVVKERQILRKQHMIANGLTNLKFYFAWILVYTILMLPTSIVIIVVTYFLKLFPTVNVIVQFIDFFLFQISGITVAFWVSSYIPFAIIAFFSVLIFNISFTGAYFGMTRIPDSVKDTLCLFISPMTIGGIVNNFHHAAIRNDTITLSNLIPFKGGKYSVFAYTFKLILNNLFYITLACVGDKLYKHLNRNGAELKKQNQFASEANARSVKNRTARAGETKLSADQVFKSYFNKKTGETSALNNVNFEICKGETFAIAGEKGAGKSTLLKLLYGRQVPSYGTINLSSQIGLDQKAIMSTIGSVSPDDDYVVIENASVANNIDLYASTLKNGINGYTLLNELQFNGKKSDQYSKLDSVEKSKVKAAIALMGDKDVLFFDEPTKGMSEKDQEAFWKLVKTHKNGKTVVFTTTSLPEAAAHADRALVLENGTVASIGEVEVGKEKILIKEEQLEVKVEC